MANHMSRGIITCVFYRFRHHVPELYGLGVPPSTDTGLTHSACRVEEPGCVKLLDHDMDFISPTHETVV